MQRNMKHVPQFFAVFTVTSSLLSRTYSLLSLRPGQVKVSKAFIQSSKGDDSDTVEFGPNGWYTPSVSNGSSILSFPPVNPAAKGGVYIPQYEVIPEMLESIGSLNKRQRIVEHDELWDKMREEAKQAALEEPLLVSFIYSTILNQHSLEAALAFHLANKLTGPSMIATQLQALFLEFMDNSQDYERSVRKDMIAVRERDPACTSYHDALLYFKGFQALQAYRVSHWLYTSRRKTLARYLQSQVNQHFQIDIHPAACIGEGVFIDHGTGVVIGETASIGDNCSILHQVTLGGSGIGCGDRHPKVGNNVLIGAGACLVGDIHIGNGVQIGACSLVVESIEEGCVAAGVPAKILGRSKVKNPASHMQQDIYAQVWGGMDI